MGGMLAFTLVLGAAGPVHAIRVLRIATPGDISSLDLHMTTGYLDRVVLLNVYDTLFALDEALDPRPSLVDKWTVGPDGLVYTLTLRRGVRFHSGKTLSAKDVVYSLTRMQNTGPRSGELKPLMKSIQAVDRLVVRITLNEANAGFLAALANPICPAVIYPDWEAERQGGTITKPIGTGPFQFVEWKKDSLVRLRKFRSYTADSRPTSGLTGKRLPLVDQVDFIPIRDSSVRAAALGRGDVDVAIDLTGLDLGRYRAKAGLTVSAQPGRTLADLRFGFKKGIFANNVKLRQAVAYALDKDEAVKAATSGLGAPARAAIPPGTPYFTSAHADDPYARPQVEQAKRLLKEAGYNGEEIVLAAPLQPEIYARLAVVLQWQLRAAGMNVRVRTLEPAAAQAAWNDGEFAMFVSGLAPGPDAAIYYCQPWEDPRTAAGYRTAESDRLCAAARAARNHQDRVAVFEELERLLRADVPWIPILYIPSVEAWRGKVKGWKAWSAGYARAWNVSLSR